nr:unnamed protein product [Callosobruchus analis]
MVNKNRKRGRRSISSSASSSDVEEDMFVEPPEPDGDGFTKASSESGWQGRSRRQRKNRSRKMHKLQLEDQVSKPPITTSTITYKESSTSQVSPTHKSTITTAVEGQKPTNSNPVSVDSSSTTAQTNSEKKVCPVVLRDPQK